jgi:hypothetical protein
MKTTIGYQAENQFLQAARSKRGLTIDGYVFKNPMDHRGDPGFDFLCDVSLPGGAASVPIKVEVKTSHNKSVVLTPTQFELAQKGYGVSYLVVVYSHTGTPYGFLKSVVPLARFIRAKARLSCRIPAE